MDSLPLSDLESPMIQLGQNYRTYPSMQKSLLDGAILGGEKKYVLTFVNLLHSFITLT